MKILLGTLLISAGVALDRNLDQFNYDVTIKDGVHKSFGPQDWERVQCPDLSTCVSIIGDPWFWIRDGISVTSPLACVSSADID